MSKTYEFAIQKHILNGGKEIYTPVVRIKKKYIWVPENKWDRLTLVEGRIVTLDLDWEPELDEEGCKDRIRQYQEYLRERVANDVQTVEFHNLEEKQF